MQKETMEFLACDLKPDLEPQSDKNEEIKGRLNTLKSQARDLSQQIFDLERQMYYEDLPAAPEDSARFMKEDRQYLEWIAKSCESYKDLHKRMFGYPANMCEDSVLVKALKEMEIGMYLMNNCGDSFEQGYYRMDSKLFERQVLGLFFEKFGLDAESGWGYISSGGSESNTWGIQNGFRKYPNGILYFCEAAHYSVLKASSLYPHYIIPQSGPHCEKIDLERLLSSIEINWSSRKSPAILMLTWGTTKYGSIDDVRTITAWLLAKQIPFYVHLDAALYGGIPNNQLDAPVVPSLSTIHVDSIAVSLHKYIGVRTVNSVVLSTSFGGGDTVSYIGQTDSTTAGSRSFQPFSTLQKIRECFHRTHAGEYRRNIELFDEMLQRYAVSYWREPLANIFVVEKPAEDVCKKFQLSTFECKDGQELAHIIVFPYHQEALLEELAWCLKNSYAKQLE